MFCGFLKKLIKSIIPVTPIKTTKSSFIKVCDLNVSFFICLCSNITYNIIATAEIAIDANDKYNESWKSWNPVNWNIHDNINKIKSNIQTALIKYLWSDFIND